MPAYDTDRFDPPAPVASVVLRHPVTGAFLSNVRNIQLAEVVQLELVYLSKRFKGQFLIIDQSLGVLGRNVLNAVAILLDGPRLNWSER